MRDLDYRIGLDIGTNSIGWSIVKLDKRNGGKFLPVEIIRAGVRMFDKAENPKTGASLAEPRRLARSSRRRLQRKSERKKEIRRLLLQHGVLTEREIEELYNSKETLPDIWNIRLEGLERPLSNKEWARLLIHLSQRRGFKSNRKSEMNDKETGKVLTSIKNNQDLLQKYRTVGEMWMQDPEFKHYEKRHNTNGQYVFNVSRLDLEREIVVLFETQRKFHSSYASEELQQDYLKVWNHQLPFTSGNTILKKVGKCSLEPQELRIPKATFTFQYYMTLDNINKVRIGPNLEPLSADRRQILLDRIFNRTKLPKRPRPIKYSDVRKWLKLEDDILFNGIIYDSEIGIHKSEGIPFVNLNAYYDIKRLLDLHTDEYGEEYSRKDFDAIGFALTVYKTDQDIRSYLENPKNIANRVYSNQLIEKLLSLSFAKFGHLSFKAIKKLIPVMEEGLSFKKAADKLGYDTTGLAKTRKGVLLPEIPDDINNPIVKRALSQARKVVNSIIKRYGSPTSIHIELARELSKTHEERSKITRDQEVNRKRNAGAIKVLEEEGGILNPKGYDIVRYKLWVEQDQKCAYSLRPIPPELFFKELRRERGSAPTLDVDHILPYSKSFMDGYQNKVLVFSDENRKKGNRLPYEYLKDNPNLWGRFEDYVNTNKNFSKQKKQFLFKREFSAHEEELVKERHINDTRYISKYFKNFLERRLLPKYPEEKKWIVTVNGKITSHLRSRWGLEKHRDQTYLHHALDAIVLACTDRSMIQRITSYYKTKENYSYIEKPSFPVPWEGFRDDLLNHLTELPIPVDIEHSISAGMPLPRYMVVSRMAKHSVTGAAHKETIMMNGGIDEKTGKTIIVKRVPLKEIKFDKNGDFPMFNKQTDLATYNAIKERYLAYNGNIKEAFEAPLYKPSNKDRKNPIKRVKVEVEQKTHVRHINGGVAQNGDLIRIDLFRKDAVYYMIPVYVIDASLPELPNKVVTSGKGYSQWKEIDHTFEFQFSLYPYDLVRLQIGEEDRFLYFNTIDIGSNRIIFKEPNYPHAQTARRYTVRGIDSMTKYTVDILGELARVQKESRQPLNKRKISEKV